MADILQITEDIPVDDSIYEYEYKEYNPIVGTNLNRGSIVLTIESQDISSILIGYSSTAIFSPIFPHFSKLGPLFKTS